MLVLSRQRDEVIMIGDDIEITVVDIRGDKVRIGILAPPQIPVHRREVYEAIKREQESGGRQAHHEKPSKGGMLVLSRQRDEVIMIGDDIEITVVDIRGDKVRIGILAPPQIPVHRREVYEEHERDRDP